MPPTDPSLAKALPLASDVDALVLAGDIREGTRAIDLYGDYPVPVIYVHGNPSDYRIGSCRVICNPRGRPGRNRMHPELPYENARFQPTLTVEV
jgi:predicted phosphodiesterase